MAFHCGFKLVFGSASNVDFCAVDSECLDAHQADAATSTCDKGDLHKARVRDQHIRMHNNGSSLYLALDIENFADLKVGIVGCLSHSDGACLEILLNMLKTTHSD